MSGDVTSQNEDESPKGKIEQVFEKMEMMALHKNAGIDISVLSDAQRDKLINVMEQNENHAFEYHTKKLDNDKEIKLARIQAGTISLRTNRNALLSIIAGCIAVTLCILFFKDEYLTVWLSFITGIAGGYGIGKIPKSEPNTKDN